MTSRCRDCRKQKNQIAESIQTFAGGRGGELQGRVWRGEKARERTKKRVQIAFTKRPHERHCRKKREKLGG